MAQVIEHLNVAHGLVIGASVGFIPILLLDPGQGDEGMPIPGPGGPIGAQGIQGPPGPVLLTDADQGEEGMPIPGATGAQGIQGTAGAAGSQGIQGLPGPLLLLDPDQGEEGMPVPGAPGAQGAQGTIGNTGPQGIQGLPGATIWTDADQGEEGMPIPGPQGFQGIVGPAGPVGPVFFADADQGEDGMIRPGAQGSQGIQGVAGAIGPVFFVDPEQGEEGMPIPGPPPGLKAGEILASFATNNTETTASLTFVDLTTPDTVTFTLTAIANVIVVYKATESLSAGTSGNTFDEVMFDGVLDAVSSNTLSFTAVGIFGNAVLIYKKAALAVGAHTIKVQHHVNASTGQWTSRALVVFRDL